MALFAIVIVIMSGIVLSRAANANRLENSGSPYLLLHADNPVDWYPWGPEALEKAKRENKPIFLSVGYSTCYWCHVAEQTIYSKQAFADLMNTWFVNIKVDREQRPDIDSIYMLATRLMTGRGGWPNNVFLTPDLKPIFAGSYFPPHNDEFGRSGFDTVFSSIHRRWSDERESVLKSADRVFAQMRDARASRGESGPVHTQVWLQSALDYWSQRADPVNGGFGEGSKFPYAPVLTLMLQEAVTRKDAELLGQVRRTLDAMAQGGLNDHLAGGFHRYTTDAGWSLPHFEKMLYDNVQLMRLYAEAYRLTGSAYYRYVAAGTADYLIARMHAAQGGFHTAEDAAVKGVEGASYLWTQRELEAVLGVEQARQLMKTYVLTPLGDQTRLQTADQVLEGVEYGVLRLRLPIADSLARTGSTDLTAMLDGFAPLRNRLLAARQQREQPARDEKILVALNGLAIEAFAIGTAVLDRPALLDIARHSAEYVYGAAYDPASGLLKHEIFRERAQTDAYLDDYALLGRGMLALHAATGERLWLERATALADSMLLRFARADGTLATSPAEKDLLIPPPEEGDAIVPSGTSAAVDLLLQLARALDENRYSTAALAVVRRHSARLDKSAPFWSLTVSALIADNIAKTASDNHPNLLDSARHVRVFATGRPGKSDDEIVIVLDIEDGYHVNANPASFDYLMPTQVVFPGLTPTVLRYPNVTLFKPAFEPAGLKVFEGKVEMRARFPSGTLTRHRPLRALVSVQACDDEVCLPPASIEVPVRLVD